MLSMKNGLFIFLLLLISPFGAAQAFDRALELEGRQTRDTLMQLVRRLAGRISDSTLSQEQQIHLFDPVLNYLRKTLPAAQKIRKQYLEEIPAPPAMLAGLHFQHLPDTGSFTQTFYDSRYTAVSLMNRYKPMEIANVINGHLQPFFYQECSISVREASISSAFGGQVFAKKLTGTQWQLWLANRSYVLRFTFDLNSSNIKDLEFTRFNDPEYLKMQLPFQLYTPQFEIDRLFLAMNKIRWDAYSTDLLRDTPTDSWLDTINQRLRAYCNQNQERFRAVREQLLKELSKTGQPDTAAWNEITDLLPEEKETFYKMLEPYFIYPDEVAYYLFSASHTIPPFNESLTEIGQNAMIGFTNSVISNDGQDVWNIRSESYSIAFEYTWNIRTGAISGLRLFKQRI